jgi:hypothetical protein
MQATEPRRRCAESGCKANAKPYKGKGPRPKRCDEHTQARKRAQDNGGSNARPQYVKCCLDHQKAGNPGLCPGHTDNRDEHRKPVLPFSRAEAEWLAGKLGVGRWHVEGPAHIKGWNTNRGCDVGTTRPEVFHVDPYAKDGDGDYLDDEAADWLAKNDHWFTDC